MFVDNGMCWGLTRNIYQSKATAFRWGIYIWLQLYLLYVYKLLSRKEVDLHFPVYYWQYATIPFPIGYWYVSGFMQANQRTQNHVHVRYLSPFYGPVTAISLSNFPLVYYPVIVTSRSTRSPKSDPNICRTMSKSRFQSAILVQLFTEVALHHIIILLYGGDGQLNLPSSIKAHDFHNRENGSHPTSRTLCGLSFSNSGKTGMFGISAASLPTLYKSKVILKLARVLFVLWMYFCVNAT